MDYFLEVNIKPKPFSRYAAIDSKNYRLSRKLVAEMAPMSVVHVNSTAEGGGVAELLKNQVPLEKDLGLNSRWLVLRQPGRFFAITKKIHNLLQGGKGSLSGREQKYFLDRLRPAGKELKVFLNKIPRPAVVVLHDPQTLPLVEFLPADVSAASRIHIDLSGPQGLALNFTKPYLLKAGKVILSHPAFRPAWLNKNKSIISYPAIDPFSQKNIPLKRSEIVKQLKGFGLDTKRPIIAQVSRFDKWKDPEGVIQTYLLAKKVLPGLQLVLEGSLNAADDPEALHLYRRLQNTYGHDPDLHLNGPKAAQKKYGELWVNALVRGAGVVLQKSLKEGFGLTVAEALWKNKAVIGGNTPGIKLQIKNGRTGFIVNSPEQCAKRIVQLFRGPKLAKKLGKQGHALVKKQFLLNRLSLDFLKIYKNIAKV